ncbi:MAG: tRNA lysidine(34) synthetase TilS [Merdibacter sp.]
MNQLKQGAWLAAVSGGADSMAMLDLCRRSGVRLHVAHVNYHKRESAMRDQRLCEEYCSRYAIPLHCLYAQNRTADNFQAEARRERYAFFAALCSEHSLSGVIVAHQQDDVLETYVMQKQRGSIPQHYGLQAETVLHGVRVIRPLLDQPRAALREYFETSGISFGDDESNASDDYQRNRVRHHVIEPTTASQRQALLQQIGRTMRSWPHAAARQSVFFAHGSVISMPCSADDPGWILQQWILAECQIPISAGRQRSCCAS